MEQTKEVQGVALYAEFSKSNATLMFIVTPDGFSQQGYEVRASLYRRVVTDYSPRKQWRNSSLSAIDFAKPLRAGDEFRRKRLAEERLSTVQQLFEIIGANGWTLIKQPIFVEVSQKDLDEIREHKTPSKIIYRINQTRKALGFPEEIVNA